MARYVLGVSAFYHDAAACLLDDGAIVLAVEEERLSRVKHDRRFPRAAIAACLAAAGIGPGDVDRVVFYEKTLPKLERQLDTWLGAFPRSLPRFVRSLSGYLDGTLDLGRYFAREGFRGDILFAEHHLAHAAGAWLSSPFARAHVLVADGVGEWATTSLWSAGPDGLEPRREVRFPDSLGLFYSLVTAHLGFQVNEDEYKVMGLAAYGEERFAAEMAALLPFVGDDGFRLERCFLRLAGRQRLAAPALDRLLGPPRPPDAPIEQRHRDLAASAQRRLEAALLRIEARLPPGEPLCFAGGVAHNGVANGKLAARRPLHVPFAPGDSGAAIGAAYVGYHLVERMPPAAAATPFLGPAYDRAACAAAASAASLRAQPLATLGGDAHVARALADGAIVGWFDGALEFGPRALGHRSILADPRAAATRDRLNLRIKRREPFRPFAPVVPAARAAELFALDHAVPWMTEIHPVRPEKRAALGAVTHVDGSARPQTLDPAALPRLSALVEAFAALTGVPALVNTSFNVAGEPIVCSPADACRTFAAAGLDALVLGDLWVTA